MQLIFPRFIRLLFGRENNFVLNFILFYQGGTHL